MNSGPDWLDPIGEETADLHAGSVQAALLSTYDPPDATLFVEDLLPRWFQIDREMSSDDSENRFFLVTLEAELQRRRGKIDVFSSAAVLGPDSQHWIWSHVARHFVGARGPAVQHAKLWLLHRVGEDGAEKLDMYISSTNLTRSAIREQVQAGFRFLAPLKPTTSRVALQSWGALVPFLQELGSHAGPAGVAAVAPWLRLLAKCRCHEGVTFIASVPGTHRGSDWGVRALGEALRLPARTEVDILVPTVGSWTKDQLESWARAVGTLPKRIGLAWVRKGHPWAKHWELPTSVVASLKESGTSILDLCEEEGDARQRLHHRFNMYDDRWPHAKIYWFERGASPRVLVTSANWSPSAWGIATGKNQLRIRNFELGVLLPARKRPLRTLKAMTEQPATVVDGMHEFEGKALWAHATFDGQRLVVQTIKSEVAPRKIDVIDPDGRRVKLAVQWKIVDDLLQTVLTRGWKTVPSVVVLTLGAAVHWLTVQDLRSFDSEESLERPLSRPPGIGEDELKRLQAALLEERYGGKLMEDVEPLTRDKKDRGVTPHPPGDFSVWLLEEARRVLAVVDTWATALAKMKSANLHDVIKRDGHQLLRLWRDEIRVGGHRKCALVVACDELDARLRSSI